MLTYDEANKLFEYRDGQLIYRISRPRRKAGTIAGSLDSHGYQRITIRGRQHKAHHIVWLLHHQQWPPSMLDHINRVRHDNRIENLRLADALLQADNRSTVNTLGVRGVELRPSGRYRARRFKHTLGTFDTIDEAAAAFKERE